MSLKLLIYCLQSYLGFLLPATEKSIFFGCSSEVDTFSVMRLHFMVLMAIQFQLFHQSDSWRKIQLALLAPLQAGHVLSGVSFNPWKTVMSFPLRPQFSGDKCSIGLIPHLGHVCFFPFLFIFQVGNFLFYSTHTKY